MRRRQNTRLRVRLSVGTRRWSIRVRVINAARVGVNISADAELCPLTDILPDPHLAHGFAGAGREGCASSFGIGLRVTRAGAKKAVCVEEISGATARSVRKDFRSMPTRTIRKTLTFNHPFLLRRVLPAADYRVVTDEMTDRAIVLCSLPACFRP
jgi:hypothetical protein